LVLDAINFFGIAFLVAVSCWWFHVNSSGGKIVVLSCRCKDRQEQIPAPIVLPA